MKKIISLLLVLALIFGFAACGSKPSQNEIKEEPRQEENVVQPEEKEAEPKQEEKEVQPEEKEEEPVIDEDGSYYSKDDVALYIHTYGHLPGNYITKKQARELGWEGGTVEKYAPGKAIGGDKFGNNEGLLPKGRKYTECDIDTNGEKSRGAKRIIFSDDGLIYYTDDHYSSFELLYGEE